MNEISHSPVTARQAKRGVPVKDVVLSQRDKIVRLCEKYAVQKLQLFGSAVRGDFDPDSSDLDFLVNFSYDCEPGIADRYLGLAEDLERLLNRSVDLVTVRSARNPYFRQSIDQSSLTLYEA
jgi:predicted nucleotidyltransferase